MNAKTILIGEKFLMLMKLIVQKQVLKVQAYIIQLIMQTK